MLLKSEESLEKTGKACAVSGFVFRHFMNGVMDCVVAEGFRSLRKLKFAFAGTGFFARALRLGRRRKHARTLRITGN